MVDIYATTIHELAHASHWNMDRSDFNDTQTKVKESWARGVQWELTRMVYSNYLGREHSTGSYTLVVADMIDNQSTDNTNYGYGYRDPDDTQDQVSGYTIRQIEDALIGVTSWSEWENNIKNDFNNGTENNLDETFNYWDSI